MPSVKIEVIINAGSGTVKAAMGGANNSSARAAENEGNNFAKHLAELLASHNTEARISLAHTGAEVIELARKAAASEADVIVAGGGDGTINSVAAAVIDSNKTLGILPFGTLNHLAKDLHIPLELEGAVETIVRGRVVRIDTGDVNEHIFLNNSSLGLYPNIVREREKQQRLGWGKWPAFVWAALSVLRRYPFLGVRLTVDGKEFVSRTPFVFVGNNEYEMENLNVGSRACLDAGKLSLYASSRIGRLGLVRLALRALFGGLRQDKDFLALCTEELWIENRHQRLRVALDGEVIELEPPLHYRVRHGALRVLVPKEPN